MLVLGAGAWGTALAIQAARAGNTVTLWGRHPARPGPPLPDGVRRTTELPEAADAVLVCVPTQALRDTLSRLKPRAPLLICCKGLEAATALLPLEVAAALHPTIPAAVLTGPNFAHDIAAGLPAAAVLASADADLRQNLVAHLATPNFRLYGSADPVGAQFGGAAKNVVAIAAGAVIGAGLGENARAALVTRGLAELSRLIVAQGGRAETASGLSGLGDLFLTCGSPASRNFAYGFALGRGEAPGPALAEGVATADALVRRAATTELPICGEVARVLAGTVSMRQAVHTLLSRRLRNEGEEPD